MTKRIKWLLTSVLIAVMAVVTVFTALNVNTAKADVQTLTGTKAQTEVTAKVDLDSFAVANTASIRTEKPNGIRFLTTISQEQANALPNNAVFGTLMIPTDILNGAELTIDTAKVANAKAVVYSTNGDNYEYVTALVGSKVSDGNFNDFAETYYGKEISARSYVTYTYTDSEEGAKTVTEYTNTVSWSIGQTAGNLLSKKYNTLTPEEITFLKNAVNAVKEVAIDQASAPVIYSSNMIDGAIEVAIPAEIDAEIIGVIGDNYSAYAVDGETLKITLSDASVTGNVSFVVFTEKNAYEINANIVANKPESTVSIDEIVLPTDSTIALTTLGVAQDYAGSVKLSVNGSAIAGATINDGKVVLPTTGVPGGEQILALEFFDKVVKVETLVVTHTANSLDTFKAWFSGDRNNTYLRLTSDITFPNNTEVYNSASPSNFTLDGDGHEISSWIESVGIFRYGGTNITIKNITLSGVKATLTVFGHGWKGNCLIENVNVVAYMTGSAKNRLLFHDGNERNVTIKDSTFDISVDSSKLNTAMCLASSSDSAIDSTNTYVFDNTVIKSAGVIADVTSNYSFINGSYFTDKNIASEATALTYDADYVMKADGKFTLDLTKFTPAVDFTKVVKMTVGGAEATYTVDGNNLVITTDNVGYKDVAFESIVNGRLTQTSAKITIATHTAGNIDEFKAWVGASKTNTCLVLTADITFPSGEVVSAGNKDTNVNFTLDGQGHTINGWYESMGFFRSGGRDITIRNIKFTNIKSVDELFGNSWYGTCYLEDIELDAYFTERQNREAIILDDCKEFKLYVKNCNFCFTMPANYVDTTYYLVTQWSSAFPHPAETSFPISFINTNVVTNGTIGEHPANFTFTNCNIVDKSDLSAVTYADEYILNSSKTSATIDLAKLSVAVAAKDICMVVIDAASVPFAVDGTNLTLTTSLYGEKDILIFTNTNAYKLSTIIATHALSDQTTFKTYWEAGHSSTYAVLTTDITLDGSSITGNWSNAYTLNGLGHTLSGFHHDVGLASTNGFGNFTMKNITINSSGASTIFGRDCYGTWYLSDVTINHTVTSTDAAKSLLFTGVRDTTVVNMTNTTINIIRNESALDFADNLHDMKSGTGSITVNMVNSSITTNGSLSGVSSEYVKDANSTINYKAIIA